MRSKKIITFFCFLMFVCMQISLQALPLEKSRFVLSPLSEKISLDLQDAPLIDVLKLFSKKTGMNFVAVDDISQKTVTLFFEHVPVDEALDKILNASNLYYEYQADSNIYLVKNIPDVDDPIVTRVFRLKYASVDGSKLKSTISITTEDGGSTASAGSTGDSGVISAIRSVISSEGAIVEDARTNSLIITDKESRFPYIENTIAQVDIPVPQILIEVEMLDVSKGTADKIGAKLGDTPLTYSGPQRTTLFPFDQNDILDKEGFDKDAYRGDEFTVGTINASGLSLILQFLRTQTDTRNLARPRILTINNETAQIKIATDEAIGTTSNTESSEGLATESVEAERVETGVFLTVTPQANLITDEITMAIYPRVIQARQSSTFADFKDPEERGSQSILKVKSGETIILGGLLRTDVSNVVTKVPILGDIPFFGRAFRHNDKSESERELVIFITPKILDGEGVLYEMNQIQNSLVNSTEKVTRQGLINQQLDLLMLETTSRY